MTIDLSPITEQELDSLNRQRLGLLPLIQNPIGNDLEEIKVFQQKLQDLSFAARRVLNAANDKIREAERKEGKKRISEEVDKRDRGLVESAIRQRDEKPKKPGKKASTNLEKLVKSLCAPSLPESVIVGTVLSILKDSMGEELTEELILTNIRKFRS